MQADNWFETLVGFPETEWDYKLSSLPKDLCSKMGTFEEVRVGALAEKIKDMPKADKVPSLKVATRNDSKFENSFDTSALQFYGPEKAMYQVASNFNCLEVGSVHTNPFSGYYVTKKMIDVTQGPSAAGGAGLGSIMRTAKHKQSGIDLLRDVNLKHTNGKLKWFNFQEDIDHHAVRIGLHTNVPANFLRTWKDFEYNENGPKIDQVFTSTCICQSGKPNKLSEILLQSAYDGTYLAAVSRQSPKLVLTLIGGGCFNNNEKQIATAIANAHNKYSQYLKPGCEVILPIYDRYNATILATLKDKTEVTHVTYE
jgi:hypothetical protein